MKRTIRSQVGDTRYAFNAPAAHHGSLLRAVLGNTRSRHESFMKPAGKRKRTRPGDLSGLETKTLFGRKFHSPVTFGDRYGAVRVTLTWHLHGERSTRARSKSVQGNAGADRAPPRGGCGPPPLGNGYGEVFADCARCSVSIWHLVCGLYHRRAEGCPLLTQSGRCGRAFNDPL